MLLSPVINTILLLAFTYFVTSLIISAINEAISGVFKLRPMHLKEGLQNLFFDDDWKKYINGDFLKSPFIEPLLRDKERFPTYIPAQNFAHAVLSHCKIDLNHLDAPGVITAIDASTCLPVKMKEVVKGYIQEGNVNLEDLQKSLEDFYDKTMQRVTGWYTRLVRRIVFYLSLAMAISLNIDTFKIVTDGLSDRDRLEHAADGIVQQISSINHDGHMVVNMEGKTVEVSTKVDTSGKIDSNLSYRSVTEQLNKSKHRINDIKLSYENTTGYVLGYENWNAFKQEWISSKPEEKHFMGINWAKFWVKLIGVVITAFALQLGSNYWFGVLNKVVSIRAAGIKPKESEDDA